MIELDATNVIGYLRQLRWLSQSEPATAQPLGWGVSNVVLRVDAANRSAVIKQSRSQLRTRAEWFSNLDRVFREADVMRVLRKILGDQVVPEVMFEDRDNFAFAMSAVPPDHVVWKQSLLAGEVDLDVGRRAGDILGTIHAGTAGSVALGQQFDDLEVFIQLRVEPFYWRLQKCHPQLESDIARIVEEMFRTRVALTHADFSPKNLLLHAGGITLVDYETGHWGDPAFDLGFFLSHLILKSIKHYPHQERYFELTRVFWDHYWAQLRLVLPHQPALSPETLTRRALGHFALCALARIDGTSPVDYLPEEPKRQIVRRLSYRVLHEQLSCWEAVLTEINGLRI